MNKQRHIIKKQIIELNLSSQQGAFELQNEVSRIYRHKIIPLIDNLLSQFSDADTIHRINTLEINLGNIDINHLEQELIDKILEQIQQQLAEKISLSSSSLSTQPQPNTESNNSSLPLTRTEAFFNKIDGDRRDNTRVNKITSVNVTRYEIPSDRIGKSDIASTRASQLEIFSYFIQTGMLPWWAEKLSKQELEEYCDRLLETSPEQLKLILAESFQQEKYSRRIIYQFSDSTLLKFTQLFASNSSDFITNYHNDIQQIYQRKIDILANISPSEFRLELWRGIFFGLLFEQYTQSKNIQFIRNHLLHISASFRLNYWLMIDKMREVVENLEQEGGSFKSQLPEILAQINPLLIKKNSKITSESEQSINPEKATVRHTSDPFSLSQPEARLINTVTPFSDSEEIYIYNSGLVLLWPFLPRFFETLKLMQQGHFVNSESAERAVLILQYLVDAATEIPEQFLSLNKILCGIDLLEPVTANLEIAEPQRDECEHLLSAVISNSSILKNTSIDGFRRAFLQREGILKVRDCSWLLQVEQETYDVLLDRLPWSIRVVKLPWMDEILYVEW